MSSTQEHDKILVIGGTGHVGRHVASQLSDLGIAVRAMSRHPDTNPPPDGVEAVSADLTDLKALDSALNGVTSVFLLWPFMTAEGASPVIDTIAKRAQRIVYLSATAVDDTRAPQDNGFWGWIEHLIEKSGVAWTFLRAGGFATNTLGWAGAIRTDGVVRWPYGEAARSLIHERDIASVAVRALTEDGHAGAKYVLTGPEVLTQAEQVRIIGEVTGHPARWEELTADEAREQLLAASWDPEFVDTALTSWASMVTNPEPATDTVREVTGAPAHTFREWAIDHVRDFLPTNEEVAGAWVSAFREGNLGKAESLMSADIVRVAPLETDGVEKELHGVTAIMENGQRLTAEYDIHHVEVEGPFMAGDRFAVRFGFDETHKPTGKRTTTRKMSLYTVADGRIEREEVFYHDKPQKVRA